MEKGNVAMIHFFCKDRNVKKVGIRAKNTCPPPLNGLRLRQCPRIYPVNMRSPRGVKLEIYFKHAFYVHNIERTSVNQTVPC